MSSQHALALANIETYNIHLRNWVLEVESEQHFTLDCHRPQANVTPFWAEARRISNCHPVPNNQSLGAPVHTSRVQAFPLFAGLQDESGTDIICLILVPLGRGKDSGEL